MAIISGMEAAKVDDVKPFELPVDALAEGVKVRQGRFDVAKDNYAKGAAALMFDVRDREEDYAERQKVIDEYNARINELSDSVGGDWSLLDNSQIQAEAIKSAQDKRVGHLKMAKKQADEYEKIAKEIEKEHGFVERFGEDANTQALYDENGNLRDLEKWSLQSKRDHVLAAHNYYKDVGTTLRSKFEMIHSTDPEYNKLPPEKKEKLWYDFWVNKHTDKETNIFQINQIKDFLVNDYKATEAGKQYYNILIRDAMKSGQPAELAKKYADETIFTLVQQIGASKYIDKETVKATMQTNTKPVEPSYRDTNPRGPGKVRGEDDKEKPVYEAPEATPHDSDVTDEGFTFEGATAYSAYRSIVNKNFNIDTLPANAAYGSINNVYAVSDHSVIVPHSTTGKGIAKDSKGSIYQIADSNPVDLKNNKLGGNIAAVRISPGMPSTLKANPYSPNYNAFLEEQIKKYKEEPNTFGILTFNKDDMDIGINMMLEDRLKEDKTYSGMTDEKTKEAYKDRLKSELLGQFIGTDGDIAPAYKAKYDEVAGYATYDMRDEYEYIKKGFDKQEEAINKNSLLNTEQKKLQLEYLNLRRKNFDIKIQDSKNKIKLLNTTMADVYADEETTYSTEEIAFMTKMEGLRSHTKALQLTADNLLYVDKMIAVSSGMTEDEYNKYIAIDSKDPKVIADKTGIINAKLGAIGTVFATHNTMGYSMLSQMEDLKDVHSDRFKNDVVNFSEHLLQGSVNVEELNANKDYMKIDRVSGLKISNLAHTMLLKNGFEVVKVEDSGLYDYRRKDGSSLGEYRDVISHLNNLESKYFDKLSDGNVSLKPNINFAKLNESYLTEAAKQIEKSNVSPKYKAYIQKTEEAKNVRLTHYRHNRFMFNEATQQGKEWKGATVDLAKGAFRSSLGVGVSNPGIKWKQVVYDKKGNPETIDLNGTEMQEVVAALNLEYNDKGGALVMKGGVKALDDLLNSAEFYIRPDFNNDVTEDGDGNYVGSFVNADMIVTHVDKATGKSRQIWIEVPLNNISQEISLAIGMNNIMVEYGQQAAASKTKSKNTLLELTVPSTRYTNNPVKKQFQIVTFETTIAGVTVPPGSLVSLKNYKKGVPLSKQYAEATSADFEVFANEFDAIKKFHKEYSAPDEQLLFAIKNISTFEAKYGALARQNPAKFEALFRLNEGDDAFEAYVAAGNSFDGMKATAMKRSNNRAHAKDPIILPGSENPNGTRGLTKKNETGKVAIINKKNGEKVATSDVNAMTTTELKHWVNQSKAQGNPNVQPVLDLIEANLNDEKDTKHSDGQLYMFAEGELPTIGFKNDKVKGKGDTPGFYALHYATNTTPVQKDVETDGVKPQVKSSSKPLVIAKEGAVNYMNQEASTAFQGLFSRLDIERDLGGMPLEVSSIARSVNNNLAQYTGDLRSFTNSSHMYGKAMDIATKRLGNDAANSSGYALLSWARANPELLKEYGIQIYHHKVEDGEWHIHAEYVGKNSDKAVLKDDEKIK